MTVAGGVGANDGEKNRGGATWTQREKGETRKEEGLGCTGKEDNGRGIGIQIKAATKW